MDNLPYNKKLIGKFLAIGAENIVYFYNSDKEVIKFPTRFSLRYLWDPEKYCHELQNGFQLLKKYLPSHINQSNLYFYKKDSPIKYVIIEPFINGKALALKDLEDEEIQNQFSEIIKVKKELETKENIFLDLFGSWGLWFWGRIKIPNLLIEKSTKKIYLVDIGTANLNDSRFFIRIIVRFAKWIQDNLLKGYSSHKVVKL